MKDIFPGAGSPFTAYPYYSTYIGTRGPQLTSFDGMLFFVANDGNTGYELWKSDGTEAGTVLVKDINPDRSQPLTLPDNRFPPPFLPPAPQALTSVGRNLFFVADDGESGPALWESDGTADGTVLVKDIDLSPANLGPAQLRNVNGALFFAAFDSEHGYELWTSDGTTEGTTMVQDIAPGPGSSSPAGLTIQTIWCSSAPTTARAGASYGLCRLIHCRRRARRQPHLQARRKARHQRMSQLIPPRRRRLHDCTRAANTHCNRSIAWLRRGQPATLPAAGCTLDRP